MSFYQLIAKFLQKRDKMVKNRGYIWWLIEFLTRLLHRMRRLFYLTFLLLAGFSISGCGERAKDVVLVWKTSPEDVVYNRYHQLIHEEFRNRGYKVRLVDCFLDNGNYGGLTLPQRLSAAMDKVTGSGHEIDLVMAYGDFSHHLVMLSKDDRLCEVPIISFNIYSEEINGRPYSRKVTMIRDSITVKENLGFAKLIFPDRYRMISLLDCRASWVDRQIQSDMSRQMSVLDTAAYFNGLGLRCSVKDMEDAAKAGKTVFYALSLENTSTNRNPDTGEEFPATWAFFSQKTDNRVIMTKYDQFSQMLQLNPDFPLYCTAVAEGFDCFGNCVGGHFSPFEVQISDAVDKAELIWGGTDPSDIPTSWHRRDYYVNWDALRGRMTLDCMPDYVHIRNVRLSDRRPNLVWAIQVASTLGVSLLILALLLVLNHYASRNYHARRELLMISNESVERMESLNMLLQGTNSVSWSIVDGKIVYENEDASLKNNIALSERHQQSNVFYREKLEQFFAIDMPGSYSIQIERCDFDGKERWYELRMTVVDTLDGLKKSGITINIDEEKRMEASLHEAHRKLALANERESFISAMSHEMRTPLNSIVGFSQILTTPGYECSEEELTLYGKAIEESNQELMKIIEDMLALTHMDHSNIRMELKESKVSDMFDHFERECLGHEGVDGRTVRYSRGPESSCVRVDTKLFDTVWKNLVGNALKFSDPSTDVVVGWTESPTAVRLYVSDQGIGIDKSNQDIIFKRFYQVDHFTQGTGLGLALAKEYVARMGAQIIVDSELGTGSTFYVRFPKNEGGQEA